MVVSASGTIMRSSGRRTVRLKANLLNHVTEKGLDLDRLARTVGTAMRMLDNVIDFYTIPEARRSNLKHPPVGLGLMGFQDALQAVRNPLCIDRGHGIRRCQHGGDQLPRISASVDLAAERGRYPSFEGSLWSKSILPIDSIKLLEDARPGVEMDTGATLDWEILRKRVKKTSLRIRGLSQSIGPAYQNLFVKSNMSGDFTVVNAQLVHDLRRAACGTR